MDRQRSQVSLHPPLRPPGVTTSITAQGGQFTYRVYAFRPLGHAEAVDTINFALRMGWIAEPPPGGTSELYTSIGSTERRLNVGAAEHQAQA